MSNFDEIEQQLIDYLGSELAKIIQTVKDKSLEVRLPELNDGEKSPTEINDLIAKTANNYSAAARMAGIAAAHARLMKSRYDRSYKGAKVGANEAERERNAMAASREEQQKLGISEAVEELASSLESSARLASESARRIALSAKAGYDAVGYT